MPASGVFQCDRPIKDLFSLLDPEGLVSVVPIRIFGIHKVFRHVHLDSSEDVDEFRESAEVNVQEVVRLLSGDLLDLILEI